MNRLFSRWVATLAAIWSLAQVTLCASASDYRVGQVSDFNFQRSPGGTLELREPWQVGDQVYFKARSRNGTELFRTDGRSVTEFDLNPGPGGSSEPTWFHLWRDSLYFNAISNAHGWELYSTSTGVPQLAADITPGPESSSPGHHSGFTEFDDHLFFFAGMQGAFGLYRTSGAGVEFVAPTSDEAPHLFNTINGLLIFTGKGESGEEYYRTDGETISLLADVNPGPAGSNPRSLFEYGGNLYFSAVGPHGRELFKTDGNSVVEFDINPGPQGSDPSGRVLFKGELYFSAAGANGYEMFKTDGTNIVEFDVNTGASNSLALVGYHAVLGDYLYFSATGPNGSEFFRTDGMSIHEFDVNPGPSDSDPLFFKVAGDSMYFRAHGPQRIELYKAHGDEVTLIDLNPGPADSHPDSSSGIEFKGSFYLSANSESGPELFRIDGTSATQIELFPGSRGSYPRSFTEFNGDLLFSAMGPNGRGIYRTDGTTIEEVFNPEMRPPDSRGIDPRITAFVPFENSLLFIAETSEGAMLYRLMAVPEPAFPLAAVLVVLHFYRHRTKVR